MHAQINPCRCMCAYARVHPHKHLKVNLLFLHLHCVPWRFCLSCKIKYIVWKKKRKRKNVEHAGKEGINRIFVNFLDQCFVYFLITSSFFATRKFSSKNPLHWYLKPMHCIYRGFYQKCTHWNFEILCFKGIRWRANFSSQMINVCTSWWTCYAFLGTEKC